MLTQFAEAEHLRFTWPDGNRLWLALAEAIRYRAFVTLIVDRIQQDRVQLDRGMKASVSNLRNYAGGPITSAQRELDTRAQSAITPLHLDIESLYLFAKVLLDRLANAIGVYFGEAQGCSLASHDSFRKSLVAYVAAKGLKLPEGFAKAVSEFQIDIDFRDKQIVHRGGRGAVRGTSWNMDTEGAQMLIHPDKQSKDAGELLASVDAYIKLVVLLLQSNYELSCLRLK